MKLSTGKQALFFVIAVLAQSAIATTEGEVIANLRSENASLRKVGAEEAKRLRRDASDELLDALMEAARRPMDPREIKARDKSTETLEAPIKSISWLAKESAVASLIWLGASSTAVATFFFSDEACEQPDWILSRAQADYVEASGIAVDLFLIEMALQSSDFQLLGQILSLFSTSGKILPQEVAQRILDNFVEGLPELNEVPLTLPERWMEFTDISVHLSAAGARDSATANKIRSVLDAVSLPFESVEQMNDVLILAGFVVDIDPNPKAASRTIRSLIAKAAASGEVSLRDELRELHQPLEKNPLREDAQTKARRQLDSYSKQLNEWDPRLLKSSFFIRRLKALSDPDERTAYLKKLITRMLKTRNPAWRKVARKIVLELWDDDDLSFRDSLRKSKSCSSILINLSKKGFIHLPEVP